MGASIFRRGGVVVAVSGAVFALASMGSAAPAASGAPCANEALRQQQGVGYLPDCMALEMVTPPSKTNRRAGQVNNAASISADGSRVQYESAAALGDTEGLGSPSGDVYVAERGSAGWRTFATSPPAAFGFGWAGVTSSGYPLAYTPAFDRWLSLQNTVVQAQNGQMTAYEADLAGVWTARSGLLTPLDSHHGVQLIREIGNDLPATSADLSHLFVRPADAFANDSNGQQGTNGYSTAFLPGDPQPTNRTAQALTRGLATWNTYVLGTDALGGSQLALIARDDGGKEWGGNCGAFVGGGGNSGQRGGRNQGAVSVDGASVYFSSRPTQPQADGVLPNEPTCEATATAALIQKDNPIIPSVVTAKGSGITSTTVEPNVVTGVSTSAGYFAVGQTVTITGSTVAPGTTITAIDPEGESSRRITLSNPVTAGAGAGKELRAGAQPLAVGEEVAATTSCPSATPCFAPGTTITAVTGQSITVSPPPLETGAGLSLFVTPPLRILHRTEEANGNVSISELVEGGPAAGSDFYEGASVDQSRVYFTSPRKLSPTDLDLSSEECSREVKLPTPTSQGCDLYLYEQLPGGGHELVQVSAGGTGDPTPGAGADVYKGVTAISGDGSRVYFAAQGVLTTDPNPEGAVAQEGKLNLYLYERADSPAEGSTVFVGELDSSCTVVEGAKPDCGSLVGSQFSYWTNASAVPLTGKTGIGTEIGGDGHVLIFESTAALTTNDQDGKRLDVFRYDSQQQTLECVSCLPTSDTAPFDVSIRKASTLSNPGPEFAEHERWTTEDGGGIVFATSEALLAQDVDGGRSNYLWQDGDLTLLPGSGEKPAISHDGSSVTFETSAQLLPFDGDSAVDIYMARANGGFPNPQSLPPCTPGESCQGPPAPPSVPPNAASQAFVGKGNPKVQRAAKKKPKPKKHKKSARGGKRPGAGKKGGHR